MVANNDLGYAEIRKIFNERDRRAAINGTAAKKLEPMPARRGELSSRERAEGHYERTPRQDEFTPSTRRSETARQKSGKRLETREERQVRKSKPSKPGKRYLSENRPHSGTGKTKSPAKLTTRQKIALTLAALGMGGAGYAAYGATQCEAIANKLPSEIPPGIIREVNSDEFIDHLTDETVDEIVSSIVQYDTPDISDNTIKDEVIVEETEAPEEFIEYCSMTDVTDRCIDAIKGWEGFHTTAYLCPGGKWTIGTGHTAGVYEGQTITEEEGNEFLRSDLEYSMGVVRKYCEKIGLDLTQAQFDSLTSFAFNCGEGNFRGSGIAEALLDEDIDEAAINMKMYRKSGGEIMPGLVERRAEEASWLYE